MAVRPVITIPLQHNVSVTIVDTPKKHVKISYQPSQQQVISLKDQLLTAAGSLPKTTQETVVRVFFELAKAVSFDVSVSIHKATSPKVHEISAILIQLPKETVSAQVEFDEASLSREIADKTNVVINRIIGDEQGKLSVSKIEDLLVAHTSMTEAVWRPLAAHLAKASVTPDPKECKNDASANDRKDPGVNGKGEAPVGRSTVTILKRPLGSQPKHDPKVVGHIGDLGVIMFHNQPPQIQLVYATCYKQKVLTEQANTSGRFSVMPDRSKELVEKVGQKDSKLAAFIQTALARHSKEKVVPMMEVHTKDFVENAKKQVAAQYPGITIGLDDDAFNTHLDLKVRDYVNELIYRERDSFLGKKGFDLSMASIALSIGAEKMKEEGSQDPFCSWTQQQFEEALQKILA